MSKPKPPVRPLDVTLDLLKQDHQLIVEALRFPAYRNLEKDERLPFEYPVTALMGRNGTNKSSVLHALYGSVMDKSIADFWFETKLDSIPEIRDGRKQSVVHQYTKNGKAIESIKARAPRGRKDPDYWEAVKPTTAYGFPKGASREPSVRANVVFIDFRSELPAFDKYFYFPDAKHLGTLAQKAKGRLRRAYRKQDYLRQRSAHVKRLIDSTGEDLTESDIAVIQYVLERDYRSGRVVEHSKYHGHRGRTMCFQAKGPAGQYSDAYAGSGESAVAFMVYDIHRAPKHSLILLDEPETSLHPRAQQRILEFICDQAARNHHQVVLSTHSPYLAEKLPRGAIRLLYSSPNGRIRISTNHSAREALHELADVPPGRVVLVEDERAKKVLEAALRRSASHSGLEVSVVVRPSGVSRIYADLRAHSASGRTDLLAVLDGDQKPSDDLPSSGMLPRGKKELDGLISSQTRGRDPVGPRLDLPSEKEATAFLEFLRNYRLFLPSANPEALVWNAEALRGLGLDMPAEDGIDDPKERIRMAASKTAAMQAESIFEFLLDRFMATESPERQSLLAVAAKVRGL